MMPTFSVNLCPFDSEKAVKIADIVGKLNENPLNREWIGEAYLKIVEGNSPETINLTGYALACENNQKLVQNARPEVSIITTEEYNQGYTGITDIVANYVNENIDDIISEIDIQSYVEEFLTIRERVYFTEGQDLWRMIQLSRMDDLIAQKKLRNLMQRLNIRDLIYYIFTKNSCYSRIEEVLG